jgi:hypothetical protein
MSRPATIHIGIDPGVNTGYAVWDSAERAIISMRTTSFWDVVDELYRLDASSVNFHVHIEDPNGNKPVFGKKSASSPATMQKIGQNVGSNKREASLLITLCQRNSWVYTAHVPKKSKVKADEFKRLTGISERTSQHVRDAVLLVIGR